MDNSLFVNDKQEVIKMFNYIKELFDEMYSGRNSDLDRIRETLFKQLIK
jgi:phytoene/squalene synthetase